MATVVKPNPNVEVYQFRYRKPDPLGDVMTDAIGWVGETPDGTICKADKRWLQAQGVDISMIPDRFFL